MGTNALEQVKEMYSMKKNGNTNEYIGEAFGISEATVRRRLKAYQRELDKPVINTEPLPTTEEQIDDIETGAVDVSPLNPHMTEMPITCSKAKEYTGIRPPSCSGGKGCQTCWMTYIAKRGNREVNFRDMDFDLAMETINEWTGWGNYTPKDPPVCEIHDQYERILVLNDIHAPYHDEAKLRWIIENLKGKVDLCCVAGDLSDMYSYSRYPKRHQKFSAVQEMISTESVIVRLAEAFPKVILMSGNHDERLRKHVIGRGIQGDELEALMYLNENFCNPLAALIQKNGVKNVEMVPLIQDHYAEWNWIWQHGDLILGHPEKYSKIPNKVVGAFIDYLVRFRSSLKLNDFRVVGAGHTHQAGKTWNDFGIVGFEMGCLSETPEYASDPKMFGARPAIKGYTLFLQDRETGRTNINLSNFYELSD